MFHIFEGQRSMCMCVHLPTGTDKASNIRPLTQINERRHVLRSKDVHYYYSVPKQALSLCFLNIKCPWHTSNYIQNKTILLKQCKIKHSSRIYTRKSSKNNPLDLSVFRIAFCVPDLNSCENISEWQRHHNLSLKIMCLGTTHALGFQIYLIRLGRQ